MSNVIPIEDKEAQARLKEFIIQLESFPINKKALADIIQHCQRTGESQLELLYGICFLVACSGLSAYQISEEMKIPIKTIKLLINNLNNAIRKLDRLGEQYIAEMYDKYPQLMDEDAQVIKITNNYFNSGYDLLREKRLSN